MDVFRACKIGYLVLGGLLLIFTFIAQFQFREKRWTKTLIWILGILVLIVFHYHMYGMGMRWYIGGYAPWSNSYETMVYVAWATVLAGLLFVRRNPLTLALATLFGGIILFVSGLNWMDPEISTLVPVLKSPWLMFHVAIIVAAYGFFGISCLMGLTNMIMIVFAGKEDNNPLINRIKGLSIINEMSLLVGLALMAIGTFLGAVWANESWGRYWGWDPKEVWALITMLVYALALHPRSLPWFHRTMFFHVFLSGMHSYGQNEHVNNILIYLYLAFGIIIVLAMLSYRSWKKNPERRRKYDK